MQPAHSAASGTPLFRAVPFNFPCRAFPSFFLHLVSSPPSSGRARLDFSAVAHTLLRPAITPILTQPRTCWCGVPSSRFLAAAYAVAQPAHTHTSCMACGMHENILSKHAWYIFQSAATTFPRTLTCTVSHHVIYHWNYSDPQRQLVGAFGNRCYNECMHITMLVLLSPALILAPLSFLRFR